MGIDLDAIRRKVLELNGSRKSSNIQLWKPGIGKYKVRCIPWKNAPEGTPFIEKWFYYIGKNRGMLTLKQFGEADPIDEFCHQLFKSGKPDERLIAKKLCPKMRAYVPVIVRGEEEKGVQVWSFGKMVYQRLLGFFIDEDVGDILDVNMGFDLKVELKQVSGKEFNDTIVDAGKQCRLHEDPEKVKAWLEAVPNLDDMYPRKTAQELEAVLNSWLNGSDDSDGTSRGDTSSKNLDKLAEDIADAKAPVAEVAPAAVETPPAEVEKPKRGRKSAPEDEPKAQKKQSLEDAFKELEDDE